MVIVVALAGELLGTRIARHIDSLTTEYLNKEVAKENERSAQLEKEAQSFRLKADELELKMKDREITKDQIAKFKAALYFLQAQKKPIWIVTANPSRETLHFISELREMLDDAGYGVNDEKPDFIDKPTGTSIITPLRGVFSTVGYTLDLKVYKDASVFVGFSQVEVPNNLPLYGRQLLSALDGAGLSVLPIPVGQNSLKIGHVIIIVTSKPGF